MAARTSIRPARGRRSGRGILAAALLGVAALAASGLFASRGSRVAAVAQGSAPAAPVSSPAPDIARHRDGDRIALRTPTPPAPPSPCTGGIAAEPVALSVETALAALSPSGREGSFSRTAWQRDESAISGSLAPEARAILLEIVRDPVRALEQRIVAAELWRAVQALHGGGSAGAPVGLLEPLRQAAGSRRHPDPVRTIAWRALAALGSDGDRTDLLEVLFTAADAERSDAAWALRTSPRAAFTEALADRVRAGADERGIELGLVVLPELEPEASRPGLPAAEHALRDAWLIELARDSRRSDRLRLRALQALDPAAAPAISGELVELLRDPSSAQCIAECAARLLSDSSGSRGTDDLAAACADPALGAERRLSAAQALARCAAPADRARGRQAVLDVAETSEDPALARRALLSLARAGDPRALEIARARRATSSDSALRTAADLVAADPGSTASPTNR